MMRRMFAASTHAVATCAFEQQQETQTTPAEVTTGKQTRPKTMPEQVKAASNLLAALEVPGQAKQEGETWQWV